MQDGDDRAQQGRVGLVVIGDNDRGVRQNGQVMLFVLAQIVARVGHGPVRLDLVRGGQVELVRLVRIFTWLQGALGQVSGIVKVPPVNLTIFILVLFMARLRWLYYFCRTVFLVNFFVLVIYFIRIFFFILACFEQSNE